MNPRSVYMYMVAIYHKGEQHKISLIIAQKAKIVKLFSLVIYELEKKEYKIFRFYYI